MIRDDDSAVGYIDTALALRFILRLLILLHLPLGISSDKIVARASDRAARPHSRPNVRFRRRPGSRAANKY